MCSPHIAATVQSRITTDGLPSRRNFLKLGGLALAGLAAPNIATPAQRDMTANIIDLSHPLSPDFPVWPGGISPERQTLGTVERGQLYSQLWLFNEHTGTHVDFPAHFIADGLRADVMDPNMLGGPAVVIDISDRINEDEDLNVMVTPDDLLAWEAANGQIPQGAFVLMYSGWEERAYDAYTYHGRQSASSPLNWPAFSAEAAEWLVNERSIHGVGVDTLSLDVGESRTYPVHYAILGSSLLGIENLANLAAIKDKNATIILGVPRYEEGSGGPARILALT